MIIKEITKYQENPSRWAGVTTENHIVYIQFKDGFLFIYVKELNHYIDTGNMIGSILRTEDMMDYTNELLDWSEVKEV